MLVFFLLWMYLQGTYQLKHCTSNFCPPIAEENIIDLDREFPLKVVGRDKETGCICRESPNRFTVCYNFNDKLIPCIKFPRNMTNIKTSAFLLKSTYITEITSGDFINIPHIKIFKMDANLKLLYIQPYVFKNMTNLTSLSLIFNPSLSYLHPHTFEGLVNLKELNLIKNGFHNIQVLSVALTPIILPKLKKLNLNENVFKNITQDAFEAMDGSPLEELNLRFCGIEHIHPKVLAPLQNLTTLRLGENSLDLDTLINLLKGSLEEDIDIMLLDLYSSGFRGSVPKPLLEVIAKTNISSLCLARNQFDILDNETFPYPLPNLISLDLTDVAAQNINDRAFSNLPNLRTLFLGKNRLSSFGASEYLPNLTYLDLQSNTDTYGWEFFLSKSQVRKMKLQYLDLHFTRIIYLSITDFGYMPYLETLNVKNCSILKIDENVFRGLVNLKSLNIENNIFFKAWVDTYFEVFGGLENLEELFVGGNAVTGIHSAKGNLFKELVNLKRLGLNRNSLQSISAEDFAPLKKLEELDISDNYLVAWDDRVFLTDKLRDLDISINKIAYLSDAMLRDFQNLSVISIEYNSFLCDCRTKNKMSFDKVGISRFQLLIKEQEIPCLSPANNSLNHFLSRIENSTLQCDKKKSYVLILVIPSVVFLVIILVIGILCYIYRWHIRYWAFLVRLYLTRKGKIRKTTERGFSNFQFDAFVSYCNQDQNFVIRLVSMLENYEPFLKLCVYERDFQVGSVISESVLEHITKSRKTLLIVSNSYAKSYWCNWETQIAEHHRLFFENPNGDCIDESIVLIKLGPINEANLNPTLKYLLKTRIYLEWDSDDDKQKVFWHKLRQFLTPPKNDVLQVTHL